MESSSRTSTGSHHSHAGAPPPPTAQRYPLAGGFVRPTKSLPSPAPSTASSRAAARLPHPRSKPLPPGSRKEDYARDYVSQRMMHISRRYVKKYGIPDPADQVTGYESMDQACADMEEVVDVLWFSGTPSIQVPTLLALALALTEYLPSFPPAPRPTFSLLQKLDHCFASLLVGQDVKTNEALPGFQRGPSAGFSRTDMVRIKSLADETRMLVAVVMSGEADVEDVEEDDNETRATGPPANALGKDLGPDKPAAAKPNSPAGDQMTDDDGDLEIIEDAMSNRNIKREQDSDDYDEEEDEGEAFVDVEPPTNKRKLSKRQELEAAVVDAAPNVMTDQELADEVKKRIKMEDSDSADIRSYSLVHKTTAPARPAATIENLERSSAQDHDRPMDTDARVEPGAETLADHQFHWTVEDSDTDSDDGYSKQTSSLHRDQPPQGSLSSLSSLQLQAQAQQLIPEDMDDDDEEAEEEELHLNVAKVYAKTLTQLGEILGETIVDE